MRVLHIIRNLDPSTGGPPIVAAQLAAAQAALGANTHVFAYQSERDAPKRSQQLIDSIPNHAAVRWGFHPVPGLLEKLTARGARARLRGYLRDYDMLHLHGVWDPILCSAAAVARKCQVPYVVSPHGMLDPWSMQQRRFKKAFAMALVYRRMLNCAAFLHVLNMDEQKLMAPLNLMSPCAMVPNGVSLEHIDPLPAKGTFRALHPELGDRPYVLFLSRLHFKKGLDFLADAFARVAEQDGQTQLVVAGPDDGAQADFQALVRRHNLEKRVWIVGALYGASKYAAMVDASCFCLPSRQEGFSLAITEAMACGTPVVISENCHFPEVAASGAGAVVPLEADSIGQALIRILKDNTLREQMGAIGAKLVRERYTWPVVARQMLDAYDRFAPAGGARG